MRVVLLGPHPPAASGALAGGVDAVVIALARGLARCPDLEVAVLTAAPGLSETQEAMTGDGYRLIAVPRPRGGRLTGQVAVVRNLEVQLAALRPDVAHAHIAGIYARAALRHAAGGGAPAVITLHGIIRREMQQAWPVSPWGTRLRWLSDGIFERLVVRAASDLIAISPYVLDEFAGATRARFHTIENPVAGLFFEAGRRRLASEASPRSGAPRLLCVARVIPRKGIRTLVEAFTQVVPTEPGATLAIVGELTSEPAYVESCRSLAQQLGIADRVAFLGGLPSATVEQQLAGADLFVLSSEQETAPVSIAEAMAAGLPVVTTDVGGCAAMVGSAGRAVPPRDPAAFAAAICDLLRSDRRSLERAAFETASARWRLDSVVAATVDLYRQLERAR